jgi:cell wall assembly regulator SMI1/predicted DNA-binding WGR domain protein
MAAESRTFEFSEGTSDKFWTITLSGSSHTVRFGRKGTSGQEQTKDFPSEDEARKSRDKLIAEKVKKGYREVSTPAADERGRGVESVADAWAWIEGWLAKNSPKALATLGPPATEEQLADLEKRLGMVLPPDLRASLRIHNGQELAESGPVGLMNGWSLLDCDGIAGWSKTMARLLDSGNFKGWEVEGKGGVKSEWWNKGWIAVLEGGGGDCLCLDMDPDRDDGGRKGQVIEFRHDDGDRSVIDYSMGSFLASFVRELADGVYSVDEEDGGLVMN